MKIFSYDLNSVETEKLTKFVERHQHRDWPPTAIGGKFTYCFTPTSIGVGIVIKCACGKKKNITDYGSW